MKGGKVYGKWPGLANEQLNEGRDLAITTDFRQVLGEAAYKTLGSPEYGGRLSRSTTKNQPLPEYS